MRQVGVLTAILPETEKWGIDSIHGLVATESALGWAPDPLLRLAAILPPDPERIEALAKRLRLSKAEAAALLAWARAPVIPDEVTDVGFDRLLYRHGAQGLALRLKLGLASARAASEGDPLAMRKSARLSVLLPRAQSYKKPVFPLGGADVTAAGVPPGPRVGEVLKLLEDFWVERNFLPDRAALIARLNEMIANSL
jgi:poly(A) polymerase